MSSVDKEYYEYLMSQDKSDLATTIMNLEPSSINNRIAESIKENDQLKQQLAEKELKHLKELKRVLNSLYGKTTMNRFQEIQRQYKISFAIDQLEKVKGKIQHNILFVDGDDYLNVIEEIDNQINELKGEK